MVSVHLRGVTKLFGETRACDGVTLDIEAGELFFLLGPSGCGKTTCLRLVAGFYEPDEGELLFDDRPMAGVPPHKRNTGMVFQNYALWPHLTVEQNVAYGLDVRGRGKAERHDGALEALEAVHMVEHAAKHPNQLSGGQQQRVALARALVIRPDVLLLDEPLSNLDAKLRAEMREEIRRLHREVGITALYVTHDQTEAITMADRIAVMNDGRIEQIGTPREIYNEPANAFVAGFIGETNFLEGTVEGVEGEVVAVSTAAGTIEGRALATGEDGLAAGAAVRCSLRPESIDVVDASEGQEAHTNRLRARIAFSVYHGSLEEFVVAVGDGGTEIKATMHNPGKHGRSIGDTVDVVFDPADVAVLRS